MTTQIATQPTQPEKKPFTRPRSAAKGVKRIKPLGWLFIAFFAVMVVGLAILVVRPLTYPIRSLPTGAEALSTAPTITPYVKPTYTVAPTPTPLPEGWTEQKGLNGKIVLVPPEDVQQELENAFNAALACTHVADATDEQLLAQPSKEELCDKQQTYFAPDIKTAHRELSNAREINTFGVMNPPQCVNPKLCTLAQAKLEVHGVMLYAAADCKAMGEAKTPCVSRQPTQLEANQLFILTFAFQEDGTWKIIEWQVEKLPGLPPSP